MIVTNYTEDLKKLPLRAIVALAARCARRVEHLALLPDDHPETDRCRRPSNAIRLAEDFAKGLPCPSLESVVREVEACRAIAEGEYVRDSAMGAIVMAAHAAATALVRAWTSAASRRNRTCSGRQARSLAPPGECHGRPGRAGRLHWRPWRRSAPGGTPTRSSRRPSRIMRSCCGSTSAAIHRQESRSTPRPGDRSGHCRLRHDETPRSPQGPASGELVTAAPLARPDGSPPGSGTSPCGDRRPAEGTILPLGAHGSRTSTPTISRSTPSMPRAWCCCFSPRTTPLILSSNFVWILG